MSGFFQPPLDGLADDPFMRDGDDRLIRRRIRSPELPA
jgi:hypothetical protein